jgi:hypothetical protein
MTRRSNKHSFNFKRKVSSMMKELNKYSGDYRCKHFYYLSLFLFLALMFLTLIPIIISFFGINSIALIDGKFFLYNHLLVIVGYTYVLLFILSISLYLPLIKICSISLKLYRGLYYHGDYEPKLIDGEYIEHKEDWRNYLPSS